jgi:uncharacterized caspase-like protein
MVRVAIALLMLLLPSAAWAQAEKRIALLIGNQSYTSEIGRLANPHNDVAQVGAALAKIGFEVISVKDAGYADLNRAVNGYIRRLNAAGPGAVGFFYYSGHGAQNRDNGTNYVIPVDVKTVDAELWDASVPLKSVTDALKDRAPNATHFVVFDACRNTLRLVEPGSKALVQAKGFEPVRVLPGMLIAFATAEGEVASDIGDGVGPYARFLAEEIVKPDVEAVTMFRSVQLRVRDTIRQEPWLSYGALSPVWFAGRNEARSPVPPTPAPVRLSEAAEAWDRAKDTNSTALLEAFIARYKDTFFAEMARVRIQALQNRPPSEAKTKEAKLPQTVSSEKATLILLEGIGLKGEVIDSNHDVVKSKCREDCSATASCVAAEHDQEFSRCSLYSSVERTIRSSRYVSFVRKDLGLEPKQRNSQLVANTGLQGDVIDSNSGISKDNCKATCIENELCVAAEHDEAFSRCTLFSRVTRSISSSRYTSFAIDGYAIK